MKIMNKRQLPNTLIELLELALEDAQKQTCTINGVEYPQKVDMALSIATCLNFCYVSLAGAVIVQNYNVSYPTYINNANSFETNKIYLLDKVQKNLRERQDFDVSTLLELLTSLGFHQTKIKKTILCLKRTFKEWRKINDKEEDYEIPPTNKEEIFSIIQQFVDELKRKKVKGDFVEVVK